MTKEHCGQADDAPLTPENFARMSPDGRRGLLLGEPEIVPFLTGQLPHFTGKELAAAGTMDHWLDAPEFLRAVETQVRGAIGKILLLEYRFRTDPQPSESNGEIETAADTVRAVLANATLRGYIESRPLTAREYRVLREILHGTFDAARIPMSELLAAKTSTEESRKRL